MKGTLEGESHEPVNITFSILTNSYYLVRSCSNKCEWFFQIHVSCFAFYGWGQPHLLLCVFFILFFLWLFIDVPKLQPHPGLEKREEEEEEEEDSEGGEEGGKKSASAAPKYRVQSGPRTPNPYAADNSSLMFPILVAFGVFIPTLFCLCRLWELEMEGTTGGWVGRETVKIETEKDREGVGGGVKVTTATQVKAYRLEGARGSENSWRSRTKNKQRNSDFWKASCKMRHKTPSLLNHSHWGKEKGM